MVAELLSRDNADLGLCDGGGEGGGGENLSFFGEFVRLWLSGAALSLFVDDVRWWIIVSVLVSPDGD